MLYIPPEICCEILIRVPAASLLRFRAVCKAWHRLIDGNSFVEAHTRHEHAANTLLIRSSTATRLFSASPDSFNAPDGCKNIARVPFKTFVHPFPDFPVASCKGLILIISANFETLKVWNWVTDEFQELPKPLKQIYVFTSGIGYDSAMYDYKVVILAGKHYWDVRRTFVYSLKYDSWKMIEDSLPGVFLHGPGVYLDGSLYWKGYLKGKLGKHMIVSFNVGNEKYSQLPLPWETNEPVKIIHTHLDAIGGCLVLSPYYRECYCYDDRLDGWVMNDCEGRKSWTKLFSLKNEDCVRWCVTFRPIAYLKSERQILLQQDKSLFLLDIEKHSRRELTVHGGADNFSCQIMSGSLFKFYQSFDAGKGVVHNKRQRNRM